MHSELKAIIYRVPNSENFWPRGGSQPAFTFVAWSDNVKYKKGPHALRATLPIVTIWQQVPGQNEIKYVIHMYICT